jgi:hypothetical protein
MKIKYNLPHVRGLGPTTQLHPGKINDVPDDVWEEFKDHPQIAPLVESGDIEVITAKAAAKAAKAAPAPAATEDKPKATKPGPKPKAAQAPAPAATEDASEPTEEELAALAAASDEASK